MIKRLAFQRLQQIAKKHPDVLENLEKNPDAFNVIMKQEFDTTDSPSQILSDNDQNKNGSLDVNGDDVKNETLSMQNNILTETKIRDVSAYLEHNMSETKIRSRALLIPVNDIVNGNRWYTDIHNTNDAVQMRYRSMSIGTGIGNDLNLLLYGKCCHTSIKHATIFYDEVTRYFELLNYSEFGTEVNGQLYSCNLTEFKPLPPPGVPESVIKSNAEAAKNAQEIIDKRRNINRQKLGLDENATYVYFFL